MRLLRAYSLLPLALLPAACGDSAARRDGEALFARHCASCHRADGQGRRAIFPPLKGHAARLASTAEGRRRLIQAPLYGRQGALVVEGVAYDGLMVPVRSLPDEDLAALLNYVTTAWGNEELLPPGHPRIQPSEVARWRVQPPLP